MSRKLWIYAILFSTFSIVTFPVSVWAMTGFYVGAGFGPEFANFNQVAWVNNPNTAVRDKEQLNGTGLFGSLFAGFGYECQQLYLAAEVNANTSSVEFESNNDEAFHHASATTKYKLDHSFGISILPGFMYSPTTLFFIRLGYTNGNFKSATSDTTLPRLNVNIGGFRYGVGIKENICHQISVVLDYSHINYQSVSGNTFDVGGATAKRTRIRPDTDQVEFAVVYNF